MPLSQIIENTTFPKLYERLCGDVIEFLKDSDEAHRIMFVCIPVEELTNARDRQEDCWKEFCEIMTLVLRSSLNAQTLYPQNLSYPGDWYKKGDCFLLIPADADREGYYFLHAEEGNNNTSVLRFQKRPIQRNTRRVKDRNFKIYEKKAIIQNAQCIRRITRIPCQIDNGYGKCSKEIGLLEQCQSDFVLESPYTSGTLVCSPVPQGGMKYAGEYVKPIVEIANRDNDIPASDVIIIAGDNATDRRTQQVINCVCPYGQTKKVIIVGSQPTDYLLQQKPITKLVTFREFHEYCATRGEYIAPKFVEIEFEWIYSTLKSLEDILLEKAEIATSDQAKYIYNTARKVFADIHFDRDRLCNFKERFVPFVEDLLETYDDDICIDDVLSELEDWCDKLEYNDNPKQTYCNKIGAVAYVSSSEQRELRNIREIRGRNNIIVIDAPKHNRESWVRNRISEVMRYRNFAQIHAVYYKNIESDLKRYSEENLKNDTLFSDGYEQQEDCSDAKPFNIEQYYNYGGLHSSFISQVNKSRIDFNDGSSENISGDVLIVGNDGQLKSKPLADIDDKSGLKIIYYHNVSDVFDSLIGAYYELPKGKTPESYSKLWHQALRKFVGEFTTDKQRQQFCKETGITTTMLNHHLTDQPPCFMKKETHMKNIINRLTEAKLITSEDAKYIIALRGYMRGTSISFGGNLKEALFEYKLNQGKGIPKFLIPLLEKTQLSIETLCEEFLCNKTIK